MNIEIKKREYFKKFNTLETLKYISIKNREKYIEQALKIKNNEKDVSYDLENIPFLNTRIAYNVIKYSNDFRGTKELNREKLKEIYYEIMEKFSYKSTSNLTQEEEILKITIGHSQEQFWRQQLFDILPYANLRNKRIMSYYNLVKPINDILTEELGIEIDSIIYENGLDVLSFIFLKNNIYSENELKQIVLEYIEKKKINIKLEQVMAILEYYTCDYEWVRTKLEKDRPFFIKPFIKTQDTKKYIIIDIYSFTWKYSEGIYWIIRNYYNNIQSNEFVNSFGSMFEKYLEGVFTFLLKRNQFENLDLNKNKRKERIADWLVKTQKYNLIIEQKSILLLSSFKVMEINIEEFKKKFIPKIEKAFFQLENTEKIKIQNNKKTIKFILLFEYFPILESLKLYFESILEKRIFDLENYLFITLDEFEILMTLLKNDEELFNLVLKERLEREKELFKGAKFFDIFEKYKIFKNEYIQHLNNEYKNIKNLKA